MENSLYINGKMITNIKSITIKEPKKNNNIHSINFTKNKKLEGTIQIDDEFNKLALLPNGYKIKKLLDIAKQTSKVRTIKKLYKRAYGLSLGVPLNVYK